jgi:hypothetical protein
MGKIKEVLKKGAISTGLSALLIFNSSGCNCGGEQAIINPDRPAITLRIDDKNIERKYNAALDYLVDFFYGKDGFRGHVSFMENSSEIKKNIDHYGGGEAGKRKVAGQYVRMHQMCLDLAVMNLGRDVPEESFVELGKKIARFQKENIFGSPIDYTSSEVISGDVEYGKARTAFFKTILEKSKRGKDFYEMVRNNLSEAEFTKLIEQEKAGRAKMYQGFKENLRRSEDKTVKIFGGGVADATRKKSDEFSDNEVKRFYGK